MYATQPESLEDLIAMILFQHSIRFQNFFCKHLGNEQDLKTFIKRQVNHRFLIGK